MATVNKITSEPGDKSEIDIESTSVDAAEGNSRRGHQREEGSRVMKKSLTKKTLAVLSLAMMVASSDAEAAGMLTNGLPPAGGTQYPSTLPLTGLELVPADTQLPSGANPASEAVSVQQIVQGTIASASNATSFTATTAQLAGGAQMTLVLTGAPATAQNITTPTATALFQSLPTQSQTVGYSYILRIVNNGGTSSGVWTVVAGTGVTITGNATVAVASSRRYQVTFTSATAATFLDIGA